MAEDEPRSVSEAMGAAESQNGKAGIPESERPNLESAVSFGDDLGEDSADGLDYDLYPDATEDAPLGYLANGQPRKRRKRGTGGSPRVSTPGKRGANAVRQKAAAGATILYGGIGVVLLGTGLAPAAGFSMQGLADEAGMPIAEWAEKRSPRFYQFLSTLSDATGIGKYVAAPVAAEGYVRIPPARAALEPVVELAHGQDFMPGIIMLRDEYDRQQAESGGWADAAENVPPVE